LTETERDRLREEWSELGAVEQPRHAPRSQKDETRST
jgi:hypothetical protein